MTEKINGHSWRKKVKCPSPVPHSIKQSERKKKRNNVNSEGVNLKLSYVKKRCWLAISKQSASMLFQTLFVESSNIVSVARRHSEIDQHRQ